MGQGIEYLEKTAQLSEVRDGAVESPLWLRTGTVQARETVQNIEALKQIHAFGFAPGRQRAFGRRFSTA